MEQLMDAKLVEINSSILNYKKIRQVKNDPRHVVYCKEKGRYRSSLDIHEPKSFTESTPSAHI